MDTEKLIDALVKDARPVRPLAAPSVRMMGWLALSLPTVAMVVSVMGLRADLAIKLGEASFVIQQAATLATALAAALAALAAGIPGAPRWKLWLPVAPLAVWLASLGHQFWQEWLRLGMSGLDLRPDFVCISSIALIGVVPAVVMTTMLRRGMPFHPRLMIALGTLAAAALADFGLRLFHITNAAFVVLVWQFGSVALFTALAGLKGRRLAGRLV